MRILAISNVFPPEGLGGYEIACAQAVNALRARGHAVDVLTSRSRLFLDDTPHVHRRFHLTDEFSLHGLGDDPLVFRSREAESRFINSYNVYQLIDTIEELRPEIVYVHNLVGIGGLGLLAGLDHLGIPWVWHLGDCVPRDICSTTDGLVAGLARAARGLFRGRYVVVSRRTWDECLAVGMDPVDVQLVPYWIEGPRPTESRTYHDGGPLRVLVAGRVDHQKGADLLIDAAARLVAAGIEDVSIDFVGRVESPEYRTRISTLGVERQVRLLGTVPHAEVMRLYGSYDVCAFPTQPREPFGMGPIEALSRGCVPLIADRCGVGEWLVHGVHALKVRRTAACFAAMLAAIRSGSVALEPIARRGAEAVWRDFHLDRLIGRIERLLAEAASDRREHRGNPAEAYRLARLAEHLTTAYVEDAIRAEAF